MTNLRVRVLHNGSTRTEHVESAVRGAAHFRQFGVEFDTAIATKTSLKDVKGGNGIGMVVHSKKDRITIFERHLAISLKELFREAPVMGLGLVPARMFHQAFGEPASKPILGLGLTRRGALVSLSRLSTLDDNLIEMAIEAVVKHELGHALGKRDHCDNQDCIMRESSSFEDFTENMLRLELCRRCNDEVQRTVNELGSQSG